MSLQEDVQKIEEKVKKVEEQSIVMELLHDQKKQNKRLFIVILVILSMWFATIGAFLYYINTTGFEETTSEIDIQDVESIDNTHIKIGDDIWEKSE